MIQYQYLTQDIVSHADTPASVGFAHLRYNSQTRMSGHGCSYINILPVWALGGLGLSQEALAGKSAAGDLQFRSPRNPVSGQGCRRVHVRGRGRASVSAIPWQY